MKNVAKKMKGKKVLSLLLAMVMMLSVASPAFSPVLGIIAKAADGDLVELAFNNIFVFESWANNSLSSTVLVDGTPQTNKDTDGLELDIENGSFTLTKNVTTCNELYTAFSLNTENAAVNKDYYMMDVEPNTTYTFSYDVTGNIYVFTPYVFFYDDTGLWINGGMVSYATPGYGYNEFSFTTPANARSIQLRWTIGDNSTNGNTGATTVTATVKDVAIFKTELKDQYLSSKNMFSFADWASNTASTTTPDASAGSFVPDVATKTISFTNVPTGGSYLWTGFGIASDASNDAYYTIDVQGNTSYTLTYDITDSNLLGPIYCQPFIVEMDSDGKCITYYGYETPQLLSNKRVFTTQANTVRIQVVFAVINEGTTETRSCKVSNIGVYETSVFTADFETVTGYPHRQTYTEGAGAYGTLPTPTNIPAGRHFAGWYTGKDGSGEAITADTEISYKSYTVYPYYQIAVDSIEVKTPPVKTTYTLGEKLNTTGLVLTAYRTYNVTDEDGNDTGETKTETLNITSGYVCTPTVLNSSGTQAITVSYGGQTTTFNVDVSEYNEKTLPVDGTEVVVQVANNVYTLNHTAPEAFNRYEITYYSDSYVKGTITMSDGTSEDFFLEPSSTGSFASYIDDYLTGGTYADIKSIGFECLDKEFGNFELYSVETIYVTPPADTMAYYENGEYKAGINLAWGGVLAYLQDKANKPVAATYADGITRVNYEGQLPSGATSTSDEVNLINVHDKGRYVQQSYYGTREEPYVLGDYNGVEWNYNPIQGGNILGEASKVVDYRITDTEIYVKTRPLEWAKWSDEAGAAYNATQPDDSKDKALIYEDSYNAWAYMESWYVFEDGMLKTYCRYVDYSGYPSATTTQEFPAFYCVEPLNNFVYYSGGEAWGSNNTVQWESDLDFWGASPEYNEMLIKNGLEAVDPYFDCNENWAAFMGGNTNDDYGIGIYTADVTDFVAGTYNTKYQDGQETLIPQVTSARHADTLDPATEDPTSYIAPINTMELTSYQEYTYSFYITTGTQEEIRADFQREKEEDTEAELAETKIAVPETVYMTPADGVSKIGKHYVNNILDSTNNYSIETVAQAEDKMYLGLHAQEATHFSVNITNVTNPNDDIYLGNSDGSGNYENTREALDENGNVEIDESRGLHFSTTGLEPGGKATAKWEITFYYGEDDTVGKTHTAYTVMYAPQRTVGAVAEARQTSNAYNEISSWITGANGVDHSLSAPLGSLKGDRKSGGTFKWDPLCNENPPTPDGTTIGTSFSSTDYINPLVTESTETPDIYAFPGYVLQTATEEQDHSRSASYLGLLAIDKSRYTNTNQIPNLKIGYDVLNYLDDQEYELWGIIYQYHSLVTYNAYYTLGTDTSFTPEADDYTAAPSGWTSANVTKPSDSKTSRESFTPSYDVSYDLDGKYIHALNQATCNQVWASSSFPITKYSTAGTSVKISITDKSSLRDAVLEGYAQNTTTPEFEEALQIAGTVLGDPSATQDEINDAKKDLDNALTDIVETFYALKYDNIFSVYEFSQHPESMKVAADRGTVTYNNGAITVVNDTITAGEAYTAYGSGEGNYLVELKPNTEYVFEYDVTSNVKSQAFMFFYNSAGGAGDVPTNMSIKTNNGAWGSKSESNPWFGNYANAGTYHFAIKFTTGANTAKAAFRFGNTSNDPTTSTFTNIKLIDADHYYEDATYSATEAVYKENASYGTMVTPVRPGYAFTGWKDASGNSVTGANIATDHLSVYSTWGEQTYTVVYDKNGDNVEGSADAKNFTYSEEFSLPDNFSRKYYKFRGWAYTADATTPVFTPGQIVKISDFSADKIDSNNTITLYAIWERGYSLYFSPNNGTGEIPGSFMGYTEPHNIPENTTITRTGYTFLGWSLDANATTPSYVAGDTLTVSGISSSYIQTDADDANEKFVVLHAVWSENEYTIVYDANGGEGSVASQNTGYDTQTALANGGFTKDKYSLVGWSTDPDATNAQYGLGETVSQLSAVDGGKVTLYAVWELSAYISADTVVIDFGLPVKISILANDAIASNGTLVAIGTGVQAGTNLETEGYTSSRLTGNAATITLGNGTAKIEGSQVVYTPASSNYEAEEVFYYEFKTADNKFYYATVTVIPATSIYFEESMFTFNDSVVTVDGEEIEYKWQDVGTSVGERFQAEDRPGTFTIADADNVYGTDSAYNDSTTYSMGSAKFITVDQNSNKANPLASASFTFTGTGFDLFTVTDNKAGLLTVSIYKDGTRVKGLAVNTYYGYTYDSEKGEYVASTEDNALFQVPAIRARNLDYGTYTVVVEPKYSYPFDVHLNKEYRIYVDSVRIYDPMGTENDVANDAYLADGEFAPDYLRLRDAVVTKDANGDYNVSTYENSALFFDGFNPDLNDVTDVIKNGPKNEVYLAKGQAVAFNISATSALNIASVQLGMKLINANGNAQVTVMNTQEQQPTEITLTSATEQFYKLDSAIVWDDEQLQQNKFVTAYPIVILNSSDADVVISLTTLKWAFEDAGADISTFSIIGDEQTLALAPAAIEWALTRIDPIDPENVAIDSPETVYVEDGKGEFTITTETEITKVTVNDVELTDYEVNEDGKKVWTYSFDAEEAGENVFNVVVYDDNGNPSETIVNTINVVEDDSNVGNIDFPFNDMFVNNLLEGIFNILRKIFEFIGGSLA